MPPRLPRKLRRQQPEARTTQKPPQQRARKARYGANIVTQIMCPCCGMWARESHIDRQGREKGFLAPVPDFIVREQQYGGRSYIQWGPQRLYTAQEKEIIRAKLQRALKELEEFEPILDAVVVEERVVRPPRPIPAAPRVKEAKLPQQQPPTLPGKLSAQSLAVMASYLEALEKSPGTPAARKGLLRKAYARIGDWTIESEDSLEQAKRRGDKLAVRRLDRWLQAFGRIAEDIENHRPVGEIAEKLRGMAHT